MINLRYHIVSITAIFLALGIGVALGGTFLDNYTVDQLNSNIAGAERRIHTTNLENSKLRAEIKTATERDKALTLLGSQEMFRGRLTGVPVLLITTEGVDKASLDTLRATIVGSGATFEGTLTLTSKLNLDAGTASDLHDALKLTSSSVVAVRQAIAARLSQALVAGAGRAVAGRPTTSTTTSTTTTTTTTIAPSGSGVTTPTTRPASVIRPEPAVVTALRAGGELDYQAPAGGSGDDPVLTLRGYRYVVVSGADAAVPDDQILLPTLRDMAASSGSLPVVAASAGVGDDPETTRTAWVGPIRNDDTLKRAVSTVDDLESFSGLAAAVLALDQLGGNVHGHYGVGDGATSLLPVSP